jgi:ferredoxin
MISKLLATIGKQCVSCGACSYACPVSAISMDRGLRAVVDAALCVGCSKCYQICPASIITMERREAQNENEHG